MEGGRVAGRERPGGPSEWMCLCGWAEVDITLRVGGGESWSGHLLAERLGAGRRGGGARRAGRVSGCVRRGMGESIHGCESTSQSSDAVRSSGQQPVPLHTLPGSGPSLQVAAIFPELVFNYLYWPTKNCAQGKEAFSKTEAWWPQTRVRPKAVAPKGSDMAVWEPRCLAEGSSKHHLASAEGLLQASRGGCLQRRTIGGTC